MKNLSPYQLAWCGKVAGSNASTASQLPSQPLLRRHPLQIFDAFAVFLG